LQLLSFLELPPWRAVLYAWHPLPILEITASGHVDGVGILFLLFTFALLSRQPAARESNGSSKSITFPTILSLLPQSILCVTAGLAFAYSGMIKLVPLFFFPVFLFLIKGRNRLLFVSGVLAGVFLLIVPFIPDLKNALATLGVYVQRWEFSSFPYRSLRTLTGSGKTSRLILYACFFSVVLVLSFRLYLRQRPYGDRNAKSCLFRAFQTCYGISMVYLFFTPTLHPWYALYLVCFLPFAVGPAGLSLTWSVLLAYRVLIPYKILGRWIEDDVTAVMIWAAPAAALFFAGLFRRFLKNS
jgi:hypothetical protein